MQLFGAKKYHPLFLTLSLSTHTKYRYIYTCVERVWGCGPINVLWEGFFFLSCLKSTVYKYNHFRVGNSLMHSSSASWSIKDVYYFFVFFSISGFLFNIEINEY